jgi:DHA1 family tetracycline resistance protein-like MFS transporter
MIALAAGLPLLFISRTIEGLGGGNLGVAQSYITDETSAEQRPRAFAYSAAAFGAGFIVGPILGGSLARFGFAVPFFVAAGLQLLAFGLTVTLLPDSRRPAHTPFRWKDLGAAMRSEALASLLWRQFLYIFAFTYFFTIFSLYLAKVLHLGPQASSLLLGIAGAIGAATLVLGVDPLVRRFGERGVAVAAFAIGIAAYALLGLASSLLAFTGVLVLWAISGSLLRPTLTAQLSNCAPAAERGTLLGFADSLNNFAMIFAPVLGGTVVQFSPRLSGVLPAIALAAGLTLAVADRTAKPQNGS